MIALVIYLFSPTQRITSQAFRLNFERAGAGEYPNGSKFNVTDIISGPILSRVYRDNQLNKYIELGNFTRSVFVLESNPEYERLASEYQARLADTRLTPIDRERLQKEFEMKTQSISKNEYAVYFSRPAGTRAIPENVARKILLDILTDWADFIVNQQHVTTYQISVLSPNVLAPTAQEQSDLVVALQMLRSRATQVLHNIRRVETLPGALQVRTQADRLSLEEARIRVDEIIRFRIEPLLGMVVRSPRLMSDRGATIRFLETQLAYDQRQLEATQSLAESTRDAIAVYEQPTAAEGGSALARGPRQAGEQQQRSAEAVTPQLSDSFLDRLMILTGRAGDAQYRQKLVDEYRGQVAEAIPAKQTVAYDLQILKDVQSGGAANASFDAASVQAQIEKTRAEIGTLIGKVSEIFQIINRNMTASSQLFVTGGPPITRTVRAVSLPRLALYGLLVVLLSVPVVVVLCLLHNRIREEEAVDYLRPERSVK